MFRPSGELFQSAYAYNKAFSGIPEKTINLASDKECHRSCQQEQSYCNMWTFDGVSSCHLFETPGELTPSMGQTSGPLVIGCLVKAMNYDGFDIEKIKNIEAAEDCQTLCQGLLTCSYFTYHVHRKVCYLKHANDKPKPNDNFISGPKHCS